MGFSSTERKELRYLVRTLEGSARELRACRERLRSLHGLPTQIATLIDTSLDHIQGQLGDIQQQQIDVKDEVRSSRKRILTGLALVLMILGIGGFGMWMIKRDTGRLQEQMTGVVTDISEVKTGFARERKFMALILARANERTKAWENMPAGQRFDLALDQIASEQKIPAKELRDLLDLYIQRVTADPDAEAEDKYNVLMCQQDFGQAAQLAGSEGRAAKARMHRQVAIENAAKALALQAAGERDKDRQRAVDFFRKEGAAQRFAARYEKALAAYNEAAALVDKATNPLEWAETQTRISIVLDKLARYKEAEALDREIVRLRETHLGPNDPALADALNNLAQSLYATNRLREAESLMERALKIDEASFGLNHPQVAIDLNNFAQLLRATNRLREAELLMERALKIDESSLSLNHPKVAIDLSNLATLLMATNRLREAEPLMQRALKIDEARFGPDHPRVATDLNNLAQLLMATNRLREAEPLMRRALKIDEATFELDHPDVAGDLGNLASCFGAPTVSARPRR